MNLKDLIFGGGVKSGGDGGTYRDSIQAWLPIKNIIGGVVITKDGRFVKILELLPVNIYLKSPNDRQNIISSFAAYLKIAPNDLQMVARTLPADTQAYVEQMQRYAEKEDNEACREMIEDNIQEIGNGIASDAMRHRFFLVFQYEASMRAKRNTVDSIIQRLNEEADTARRYLDVCELEVLEPRYSDNFVLKLLYEILSKKTSQRVRLPDGVFDAEELFELYQRCANRKQIETICLNYLRGLEATKLSVNGHMYFVPRTHMDQVDIFEDFITLLSGLNKRTTPLIVNSFYIIDDAKQREKMTEEFYNAVKKEIAVYQEKCDYLIKSNSQSPAIMDRWILKVQALEEKKRHYEGVLQRELSGLDDEFSVLKLLSQELQVRSNSIRNQRFRQRAA